jgi:hypothetical protein
LARSLLCFRDSAQNTVQRADAKFFMSWNCNALMQGVISFQNDMASRLMNPTVFPLLAETL